MASSAPRPPVLLSPRPLTKQPRRDSRDTLSESSAADSNDRHQQQRPQRRLAPRNDPPPRSHSPDLIQLRSIPKHLEPKAPPDWAPWASKLAAVHHFYRQHIPDFSGIDMCNTKLLTRNLKHLIKMNNAVVTIFVLYGETDGSASGFNLPLDIIYQLKSYMYRVIQHHLKTNPFEDDPVLELIIQVRCLAGYEAGTSLDPTPALTHLRGIKRLVDNYPNNRADDYFPKTKAALLWIDRSLKHLHNTDDFIFPPPTDAFWNPASPLLLGTLPPPDRLPSRQAWIRLLVSAHMAPGNEMLLYIHTILAHWPASERGKQGMACAARTRMMLHDVQARLLAQTPAAQAELLIFRDERFALQRVACEALRRTALVLVSMALELVDEPQLTVETLASRPAVDHALQSVLGIHFTTIRSQAPEVVLWCLSVVGPLLGEGVLRDELARQFRDVLRTLSLQTFKKLLVKLVKLYAVPLVHDVALWAFWEKATRAATRRVGPVGGATEEGVQGVSFETTEPVDLPL